MKRISMVFAVCMAIAFVAAGAYAASCPMMSANGKTAAMKAGACPMSGGMSGSSTMDMSKCPMMGKAKSGARASAMKSGARRPVSAVCPVMGTRIPNVSKAYGKSVYKGKTYYFCCPECKPLFDKNPGKYVKGRK